jgi:hypothetical protein
VPGFDSFSGRSGGGLPIDEVTRLNRRLQLLTKFTPELGQDPMAAYQIASANNDDDDMMRSVLETQQFVNIQDRIEQLREAPDDYQRATFASLPKPMQQQFRKSGYQPPERGDGDDNGWFKVNLPNLPKIGPVDLPDLPEIGPGDGLAKLAAPIAGAVGLGLNTVNWGMEAMGSLPRWLAHTYRSLEYSEDRDINVFEAWRRTEKGEMTFYEDAEEKAREALDSEEDFETATLMSGGKTFEEIAARRYQRDTPEFGREVLRLYELSQDKKFAKAKRFLDLGKMSLGRAFGDAFATPGTTPYNIISGAIDGGVQLVDPSLLLAGSGAALKAARWGGMAGDGANSIRRLEHFEDLYSRLKAGEKLDRGTGRVVDSVADKLAMDRRTAEGVARFVDGVVREFAKETPDFVKLTNEQPRLLQVVDSMRKWHADEITDGMPGLADPKGVFDYLKSDEGWKGLVSSSSGFGKNRYQMPHITATGQQKIRAKEWFRTNIDELLDDPRVLETMRERVQEKELALPQQVLDAINGDDEVSKTMSFLQENWLGKPVRGGAALVRGVAMHVPRSNVLNLYGPDAAAEFTRLANTGVLGNMPPRVVNAFINEFVQQGTMGQRHIVARHFFNEMFAAAGASDEMIERYTSKNFKFSMHRDGDLVEIGLDEAFRTALYPSTQESFAISMPNVKQMARELKEYNFMDGLIGKRPVSWLDSKVGRYWNPMVLLRIGFIPRAYGEEMFNLFLREGPLAWTDARFNRWVAMGAQNQKGFRLRTDEFKVSSIFDDSWTDEFGAMNLKQLDDLMPVRQFYKASAKLAASTLGNPKMADEWNLLKGYAHWRAVRSLDLVHGLGLTPFRVAQRELTQLGLKVAPDRITEGKQKAAHILRLLEENPALLEGAEKVESMRWRELADLFDAKITMAPTMEYRQEVKQIAEAMPVTISAGPWGKTETRSLVVNKSNFKEVTQQMAEYLPAIERLYIRDARDPFKLAGLQVMNDLIDPVMAGRVQTLAQGTRFAGENAAETINNFRTWTRKSLNRRNRMRKLLRGDETAEEVDLLAKLRAKEGNEDVVGFLERLIDQPDVAALVRSGDLWAPVRQVGDDEDIVQTMAAAIEKVMFEPQHARAVAGNGNTVVQGGKRVAHPVADGHVRLYSPVVTDEAYKKFSVLDNVRRFQDRLQYELDQVGRGDLYDEIVDVVLPEPGLGLEELNKARSAITDSYKPGSLWASSNPQVARAVAKAMTEGAGIKDSAMIGFKDVTEKAVMESRSDLINMRGVKMTGDGGWETAASFYLDAGHAVKVQPIGNDAAHMVKVKGKGWMDKVEYDRLDVKPELEAQALGDGISMESAVRAWSEKIAEDILTQYTGANGRFLHEVIEPSVSRDIQHGDLFKIQIDELPPVVYGPEMVLPKELGSWDKMVRFGFDKVIGRAGAAIVRNDMFVHYVGRSLDELKPEAMRRFLSPQLHQDVAPIAKRLGRKEDDLLEAFAEIAHLAEKKSVPLKKINRALQEKLGLRDPLLDMEIVNPVLGPSAPKVRVMNEAGEVDPLAYRSAKEARARGEIPENPYTLKAREVAQLRAWAKNIKNYDEHLREIAITRAFNEVAPFIDDRRFRSQFQENVGSFIPFMFAEEQFVKRWARTIAQNPDALYKAILTMNGLRSMGVIKEDPTTGEEIFVYPGSTQLTQALSKTISWVTGKDIAIPYAPAFGGQVRYTFPGMDGGVPGVPAAGPLVGVALTGLSHAFPEIEGVKNWTLGEKAEGRQWWSFLVPASVSRLWDVYGGDDEQIASAMIEAMAYLEANDHAPGPGARTKEIEEYKDRVEAQARIIMATRFVYGFVGPAGPQRLAPQAELVDELQELIQSGAPVDEALKKFLAKNPDATPFTVFKSDVPSNAPLSQTDTALKWMEDNEEYLSTFRMAAPYLLPQDRSDEFERKAYYKQIANGMRVRRSPDEWYEEMKFASAAGTYFDSLDNFEAARAATDDPQQRKAISLSFDAWKQSYFTQHPMFAEMLRDPTKQMRRTQILDEMRLIVADPKAPDSPALESIRGLMKSWDQFQMEYRALKNDRRGAVVDYRKELKASFARWAYAFVDENPSAKALFQRVMLRELDLSGEEMNEVAA